MSTIQTGVLTVITDDEIEKYTDPKTKKLDKFRMFESLFDQLTEQYARRLGGFRFENMQLEVNEETVIALFPHFDVDVSKYDSPEEAEKAARVVKYENMAIVTDRFIPKGYLFLTTKKGVA